MRTVCESLEKSKCLKECAADYANPATPRELFAIIRVIRVIPGCPFCLYQWARATRLMATQCKHLDPAGSAKAIFAEITHIHKGADKDTIGVDYQII